MILARIATVAVFLSALAYPAEVRPGVWGGKDLSAFPLPATGYQLYLLGELHGVKENEAIFAQYLAKLHANGLRDVALEEDVVYEPDAQAYVDGKTKQVPPDLCLRANILDAVRRLNEGRSPQDRVRVHLVDVDSPADAIRAHLLRVQQQASGASGIEVPPESAIAARGLSTVESLKRLALSPDLRRELRTIEHSIRCLQQGLEVSLGPAKGSTYLEDREQAVASNLEDLARDPSIHGVLIFYGNDHVSRTPRKDGGPNRDQPFDPIALRLRKAGIKAFSIVSFILSGKWSWRGQPQEALWSAEDGHLANGETLDKVLAAASQPALLYIDRTRERASIPSSDLSAYEVDAYLLIAVSTEMENRCVLRPR